MSTRFSIYRRRLLAFQHLAGRRKLLYMEALFYLSLAMFFVKYIPFRWWSRYLGTTEDQSLAFIPVPSATLNEVGKVIRRLNWLFGGRFTCLMQAVAGKIMLNHRGIPNVLVLGVYTERDANQGLKMNAHAWLKSDSTILLGGEVQKRFTAITQFHS